MNERLFRSGDDRVLAGVAGGMAEAWDLDPALVRIGWVVLTPLTAGFAILVYIVMAIVVPLDDGSPQPSRTTMSGPSAFSWTSAPSSPGAPGAAAPAGSGPVAGGPGGIGATDPPPAGPTAAGLGATPGVVGGPSAAPGSSSAPMGATGPMPGSSAWSNNRRAEREARRADRRAARDARRAARGYGPGSGAIVGGLILILLGGGFLASELVPGFDWHAVWPIGLIGIGVLLLVGSLRPRGDGS